MYIFVLCIHEGNFRRNGRDRELDHGRVPQFLATSELLKFVTLVPLEIII